MKKFIYIFLFFPILFPVIVIAQSNWFIQPVGSSDAFLWDVKIIDSNTTFISASEGRVFKTTNEGANWNIQTITSSGDLLSIYFTDSNTGYTAGSQGKIFKTTNSGSNWIQLLSPTTNSIQSISFSSNDVGCIAGGSANDGEIFRTTNGGINWTEVGPGGVFPQILSLTFPSVSFGYAVGVNGIILRTMNSGLNWTILPSILGNSNYFSVRSIDPMTAYAVTPDGGKIIKTSDLGNSWNLIYSNSNNFLVSVNFPSADTGFVIGGAANNTVVLKTTNAGANWREELLNFSGHLNSIDFLNTSTGYIAGDQGRLYKTTNGGAIIGINQIFSEIPEKFELQQNYPNPFNPDTKINYSLPTAQHTILKVYDELGNEIATLVNEKQNPGSYSYQFSTVNYKLSSGIYFYKLTAGNFSETKRMVLLK